MPAAALKAEKLQPDPGTRYSQVNVPQLNGLTCAQGNGGFHFGDDLDMHVFGTDDLPTRQGDQDDDHGTASCFGNPRIRLSKGPHTATVPHFTAKTVLFATVADPQGALDKSFKDTMELVEGYGRTPVGEPRSYSTKTLVMKCQQNITDTFPMTTCFWANYSAVGSLDFFPPNNEHVPLDQAAEQTRTFATAALATHP
ncbi:hypothetical protein KV557_01715 [Kitasatospora aureofaciens]|uniref:hypothetical protein n=1 Tax=Kitasatospora aureofaciens TaxID=1894 RepID=UPI001C44EA46|nr:hypothetical protein [Kitasatospora aureofaciens]MBV6695841.1 hypothetical protein [Kitasatospora aureofaciens]